MRAIQFHEFGGYDRLRLVDLPSPTIEEGQVLVRMRLAGVNPLDHTVRSGGLPFGKAPPMIPGGGGVGEIVDADSTSLPARARVLISGGGYGLSEDGTWRMAWSTAAGCEMAVRPTESTL
jgi:NADPH:quinone reductase-like Zn-dependent oxidoreductase